MFHPTDSFIKHGYALVESCVPVTLVEWMRKDLDKAYAILRPMQLAAGLLLETNGALHHLPAIKELHSFRHFLEVNPVADHISDYFEGKNYCLQSFGGNLNFPDSSNYASSVHRDQRSYFRDRMMLNTLVTLDDMDQLNGGTWLMPGGHKIDLKPSEGEWNVKAVQITAPVGSVLMWDSRLWHKAGINRSDKPRRIVTPIFCLPFYKPEFDYAGALYGVDLSPTLKQVLGVYARTPRTFEEYYQPKEKRMYQADQG